MPRKILIAEQTDVVRSVAETVLRQNGFDVIAVTAAQKAREVLELSRPDLIIVGADLIAPNGSRYYETLSQDAQRSRIPILLFEPADKSELPVPAELVISRPFDPKDFLGKVTAALNTREKSAAGPLAGADIDDRDLDAALGLDEISVTSSEVMDKTTVGKRGQAPGDKPIGMDTSRGIEIDDTGGIRVDSLVLDMNSSRAVRQVAGRKAPTNEGTGKLEILSDQYGLEKPPPASQEEQAEHDYNWFIDAVKKDNESPKSASQGSKAATPPAVDTRQPGPVQRQPAATPGGGVEKFIDEFKKEMQQLKDTEPETIVPDVKTIGPDRAEVPLEWQEKLEQLGPADLDTFTREFAQELGRRVADIIAAKIDPDKLMRLIKADIIERHSKSK